MIKTDALQLPPHFAGWTVVDAQHNDEHRSGSMVNIIRRHIDEAHMLVLEFDTIDWTDVWYVQDYIDDLIELLDEHAPDGTVFERHVDGGCLGFWILSEYDPERVEVTR